MRLVDVHCHLNHERFKKVVGDVLARAKKAGVVKIIMSGVNPPTNREVLLMSKTYPELVECSFGAYPIDALNVKVEALEEAGLARAKKFDLDEELTWIEEHKDECVAVGEVGLDYKWVVDAGLQKKMRDNFQKIIGFCEKIKKPIIVHSRRAEKDCVDMLESSRIKHKVLHCFEGRKSLVRRAADAGFCFSVPTVIARLKHFEMLVENVNINQLLTETDSPWLAPVAGERNEPANVRVVVEKIAQIKKLAREEVANNVFMNYQQVFG